MFTVLLPRWFPLQLESIALVKVAPTILFCSEIRGVGSPWTHSRISYAGRKFRKAGSLVARPYWSGYLQISLVSFAVRLFPATEAASEIALHQIDRNTGERIRHRNVAPDKKTVDKSDIMEAAAQGRVKSKAGRAEAGQAFLSPETDCVS